MKLFSVMPKKFKVTNFIFRTNSLTEIAYENGGAVDLTDQKNEHVDESTNVVTNIFPESTLTSTIYKYYMFAKSLRDQKYKIIQKGLNNNFELYSCQHEHSKIKLINRVNMSTYSVFHRKC